jgi:hypothetical protein
MHENFLSPYRQSIHRRDIWRVFADESVLQEMISSADKVRKILAEQIQYDRRPTHEVIHHGKKITKEESLYSLRNVSFLQR